MRDLFTDLLPGKSKPFFKKFVSMLSTPAMKEQMSQYMDTINPDLHPFKPHILRTPTIGSQVVNGIISLSYC